MLDQRNNPEPTKLHLRMFGCAMACMAAAVGVKVVRSGGFTLAASVPAIVSVAFLCAGIVCPERLQRPYRLWKTLIRPVALACRTTALTLVFFLVVTPYGLCMRILRYDPLRRRFGAGDPTHWIRRQPREPGIRRYLRQF